MMKSAFGVEHGDEVAKAGPPLPMHMRGKSAFKLSLAKPKPPGRAQQAAAAYQRGKGKPKVDLTRRDFIKALNLPGMGSLKPPTFKPMAQKMGTQARGFASGAMGGGRSSRPGFSAGAKAGAGMRRGAQRTGSFVNNNRRPLAAGVGAGAGLGAAAANTPEKNKLNQFRR